MMMARKSKGLTERHERILKFLAEYQAESGRPPSIREIGEKADISSTSVVNYYLDQLEKLGFIERDERVSRGLRLTDKMAQFMKPVNDAIAELLNIPVMGRIVASAPAPMPTSDFNYFDSESSVEIARSLLPSRERGATDLFALEVQGDSMIDAMVSDGDMVIMKRAEEANNGDMVAIWLPERDETTLKYFFKEKDGYRLQPANPTMEPIYIKKTERIEIKGKVVMVIRKVSRPQ
jgi:repressor LexA